MRRLSPLLTALLLTACPDGGDDKDPVDTGVLPDDTPVESGCEPIGASPTSWSETLTLQSDGNGDEVTLSAPGSRGHGRLRAVVDWSRYGGVPQVGFTNADEEYIAGHVQIEDTTSITAEVQLRAGDSIVLRAEEFQVAEEEEEYPVNLPVEVSWTPVEDCWEGNDTQAEAVVLPVDTEGEAFLLGTHMSHDPDAYVHLSHDDHYRIPVPAGATTLHVDLGWSVQDGSLSASLFPANLTPGDAQITGYVGGEHGGSLRLSADPSLSPDREWILFVQKWDGEAFNAWATPADEGPRTPDTWTEPYSISVTTE